MQRIEPHYQVLPHHINDLANALMTVEARKRPALARELIANAKARGDHFTGKNRDYAEQRGGTAYQVCGPDVHGISLEHKHICESANPGTFYIARIDTRDGLQAWEVAIAAMTDLVREGEDMAVAA